MSDPQAGKPVEMVAIEVEPGLMEADLRKALLESYGIPVTYRSQEIMNWRLSNVGPFGEITLMVPADRAEEARELLRSAEAGEIEYEWGDEDAGAEDAR